MTVHVGVNALFVRAGIVGGTETYVVELLRALDQADPEFEFTVYANSGLLASHPDLGVRHRFVAVDAPDVPPARRIVAEHTWLVRCVRRDGIDLLHHLGGTVPSLSSAPGLVTIHDIQPILHPERFSMVKRTYLRTALPAALRRSVRSVAVSDFIREQMIAQLSADPDKVDVVRIGVDPSPVPSGVDPGIAGRYFLHPAIAYEHKGHRTLIRAFGMLDRDDVRLVLTGGSGPIEAEVMAALEASPVADRIDRLGWVTAERLDGLYRGAVALSFPSEYEGLGIPALEAMARDCPVIATQTTGLTEAVGDAGVLVEIGDLRALVAAMERLLDDDSERQRLIAAGRARVAEFSWDHSAQAQLESYRRTLADLAG
ncbi:MAG TPA: glycosyltransferase family 1 protein [Acidimicrobiales bacterium]|nr:glycosyltransferase family 1 protein [Acidimicrobiales bacterium]